MFKEIYEIQLAGKQIQVSHDTWANIRDHVRQNRWFYVIYNGEKYKFTHDQVFYERPTRFDFEIQNPLEDDSPDIIYIR